MIKLIACDLDGTLLTPDGELPEGTFSVIGKLYEKGILFCPASGRQVSVPAGADRASIGRGRSGIPGISLEGIFARKPPFSLGRGDGVFS